MRRIFFVLMLLVGFAETTGCATQHTCAALEADGLGEACEESDREPQSIKVPRARSARGAKERQ